MEPHTATPGVGFAWILLAIAGIFEIIWAVGLKYTFGFSRFWPSSLTIAAMAFSFVFLSLALKVIPVGTAYAVWTGIGVVGTAALGIVFFQEPVTIVRIFCILLIVIGIAGLKVFSAG